MTCLLRTEHICSIRGSSPPVAARRRNGWAWPASTSAKNALALQPPILSGARPDQTTKMTGQMALIGKARGEGDLREGDIGIGQQFLRAPDPLLHEIGVRRLTCRPLERAREMKDRKPRNPGQRLKIHAPIQVRVDILVQAPDDAGREATARLGRRRNLCDDTQ